jgi:hypothetical protein
MTQHQFWTHFYAFCSGAILALLWAMWRLDVKRHDDGDRP